MKKIVSIWIIMALVFSLTGCGGSSDSRPAGNSNSNSVQNVAKDTYDVDLTKLSSTMVYSEVYDIMTDPEKYIGKSIRMKGQFDIYQGEDENGKPIPDRIYFACVIADATACCAQGIEFVLTGEHTYPEDYPDLGDEIVVSGIFETYEEDGYLYCHLIDAVLE